MFAISTQPPISSEDAYRGAQNDLIVRGSGALSIVGSLAALALAPFFPPTAQIGALGWALILPTSVLGIVLGMLSITLRHRPSMTAIAASSYTGVVQVAILQWLAGGGKAPYIQLLLLPTLGASMGQPVWSCARVMLIASAGALSPLLYSNVDVPTTATEFTLLTVMSLMTATVTSSTRAHRARLKDAGEHANTLAHVDPLTGMLNRRAFDEELLGALASLERAGTRAALVLCDVNSFKNINDTFGHAVGDEALRAIAKVLCDAVRRPDVPFRWAGDEFAVILRDTDELGANRVAARLRDAVDRHCKRPDGLPITIGTGVSELTPSASTDEVLRAADRALLNHKAHRRQLLITA